MTERLLWWIAAFVAASIVGGLLVRMSPPLARFALSVVGFAVTFYMVLVLRDRSNRVTGRV